MAESAKRPLPTRLDVSWTEARAGGAGALLVMLTILLAGAVVIALVLARLGVDVRASVSFPANDGWCDQATEAVGSHCWGDFAAIRFDEIASAPNEAEALYPMATRLVRWPFMLLVDSYGYRAGIAAWLAVLAACCVAPIAWATRRYGLSRSGWAVAVAGVLTMPTLVILDRGNMVGLALPFLFVAAVGMVERRPGLVVTGIVLASVIKPQYAVLLSALVAFRWWRALASAVVAIGIVNVVAAGVAGGRGVADAISWLPAYVEWARVHPVSDPWPVNVSFARVFYVLGDLLRDATGAQVGDAGLAVICSWVSVMLVVAALAVLSWRGAHLDRRVLAVSLLALASLASPVTYSYYLSFAIVACAVFLASGGIRADGMSRRAAVVVTIAICTSLTPLLVPTDLLTRTASGFLLIGSAVPVVASAAWLVVSASAASRLLYRR